MTSPLRRWLIGIVLAGSVLLAAASILLGWHVPPWGYVVGAIAAVAVAGLLAGPRRPTRSSTDLYASDAYSDIALGRSGNTHPYRAANESSQIDDRDRPDDLPHPRGSSATLEP